MVCLRRFRTDFSWVLTLVKPACTQRLKRREMRATSRNAGQSARRGASGTFARCSTRSAETADRAGRKTETVRRRQAHLPKSRSRGLTSDPADLDACPALRPSLKTGPNRHVRRSRAAELCRLQGLRAQRCAAIHGWPRAFSVRFLRLRGKYHQMSCANFCQICALHQVFIVSGVAVR